MTNAIYYYETEDGSIHQYIVPISEVFMVNILSGIGRKKIEASVHDLPNDIKTFFFPTGRIWYANGNRFVAQKPVQYRQIMANYTRQQSIDEAKKKNG